MGLSGSTGGLGSVVSSPGTPRAGGSSSQSLSDSEEDVPQAPPTTWLHQHLGVSRPRPPCPAPALVFPDQSLLGTPSPRPGGGPA